MMTPFANGFASELLKLAVADIEPDPPEANRPWESDNEARGIKETASRPSAVQSGHLGPSGSGKTTDPGRGRSNDSDPDVQTGIE
jgi:hypothetical protein